MNNFRLNFCTVIWAALVGVSSVGCSRSDNDQITIGVVMSLTGEIASYGEPIKAGIEIALEELNARESEGAKKYALKIVDSQANQKIAVSGLQQMINVDNIRYVVGDVSSPTNLAMVPVAEKNQVFMLSHSSSPKLTNISPFFARNYPSSLAESIASAEFVFNELGHQEAALIYVNNEYGIGLAKFFEEKFTELGGTISMKESYAFEQNDFRTLIAKIRTQNPELIYLAGHQKEMGSFMRQFGEIEITAQIVSNLAFLEPECLSLAGDAANGAIAPLPYYDPEDPNMSGSFEFGNKYREMHDSNPSIAVAVGYDAMKIMATAIESKGEENVNQVASYVRNLKNYDGAMGLLNFTDGDVRVPLQFKIVRDGVPVNYHDQ